MQRDLAEQFSQEVENYRRALLFCARKCDWEAFKSKAGRLFDYVESIEFRELERRFFKTFYGILIVLCLAVAALFSVNYEVHQELQNFKRTAMLCALIVSSFELFFFLNYRMYTSGKSLNYRQRRETFIRLIEKDFRGYTADADKSKG